MGDEELIVKAAEEHLMLYAEVMTEHAENLGRDIVFIDSVMVVETSLSAPADVEGGENMSL